MSPETAARLASLQIEQIAQGGKYFLFARGICIGMLYEGSLGSTGYMTEKGPAYLMWRDGRPWLVSKGSEVAAKPEQVEEIQQFSQDLKKALWPQINTDEHG